MISHEQGIELARGWIDDWNRHDLEAVLARLAADVTFSSPLVPVVTGDPSGVCRGLDAVRAYWTAALRRVPDLHFDLLGVTVGHDAVAVRYVNQRGHESVEVLIVGDDGLVVRGAGTYASPPGRP